MKAKRHATWWLCAAMALSSLLPEAGNAQASTAPEEVTLTDGTAVALWRPPAGAAKPYPLVLFSHGVLGCRDQSSTLLQALAEHGMMVAAVNHADNRCEEVLDPGKLPKEFDPAYQWTDATYRDRAEQLRKLRAAIEADSQLGGLVDRSRLILVGHSLGGYTVLGLAGARPAWKLDGVSAVIAWAPYTKPYLGSKATGGVSVPTLYQIGTLDPVTPDALAAFNETPSPTCLVTHVGANHFAWVEPALVKPDLRQSGFTNEITSATLTFLDKVLNKTGPGPVSAPGTCR
jgi:dienelactone hydrolase